MKEKLCLVACATVLGLAVLPGSANLVYDGNFESLAPDSIIDDTGGYHQWGDNSKWISNPTGVVIRTGIGDNTTQVAELTANNGLLYQNTGGDFADGTGIQNTTFDWSFAYYIPSATTDGGFNYAFKASSGWNIDGGYGDSGFIAWDSAAADTWHTVSGSFDVGAYTLDPANPYLMKWDFGHDASDGSFYIDDVVANAIPEPAALGLIALASIGALVVRRFRM